MTWQLINGIYNYMQQLLLADLVGFLVKTRLSIGWKWRNFYLRERTSALMAKHDAYAKKTVTHNMCVSFSSNMSLCVAAAAPPHDVFFQLTVVRSYSWRELNFHFYNVFSICIILLIVLLISNNYLYKTTWPYYLTNNSSYSANHSFIHS